MALLYFLFIHGENHTRSQAPPIPVVAYEHEET